MQSIRFPLISVLLFLGACSPPTPPSLTQTQKDSLATEIRAFVGELTAAMNSHDPERFLALYLDSPDFVYMGCTEGLFGFRDFSIRVAPYYRTRTDVTFQQEILAIQLLNSTTAVVTLQGSTSDAGALFWTEVLVRGEDGGWLIAHEHESWPGCAEPSTPHPGGDVEG